MSVISLLIAYALMIANGTYVFLLYQKRFIVKATFWLAASAFLTSALTLLMLLELSSEQQ